MKAKFLRPKLSSKGLVFSMPMFYGFSGGASLRDESGNGYTGTAINSPIPRYPGFDFTAASSQYIDIGSGPLGVKTIVFWVKPNAVNVTDYPIDLNGNSVRIVNGTVTLQGFTGGTNIIYVDGAVDTTITAAWHMIAITCTTGRNCTDFDIARETNPEQLGSNLITNGSFATSASWNFGGEWSHNPSEQKADYSYSAAPESDLVQSISVTNGTTYRVAFTVNNYNASTPPFVAIGSDTENITGDGEFSEDITYTGSTGSANFQIVCFAADTSMSVDDVSVREITPASQNYYDGLGTGVRLYDSVLTAVDILNIYNLTKWRFQT